MACSRCKKKTLITKESEKEFNSVDKLASWMVITWTLFGLYGLYNLIMDIIHLFK
jgi:hypothetical protein